MKITIEHENLRNPITIEWTPTGGPNTTITTPQSSISCHMDTPVAALAMALHDALTMWSAQEAEYDAEDAEHTP